MKFNSYKLKLSKILSYIGQNYSLTQAEFEEFQEYATYYFRVIPPIVASDIELLHDACEFLKSIVNSKITK